MIFWFWLVSLSSTRSHIHSLLRVPRNLSFWIRSSICNCIRNPNLISFLSDVLWWMQILKISVCSLDDHLSSENIYLELHPLLVQVLRFLRWYPRIFLEPNWLHFVCLSLHDGMQGSHRKGDVLRRGGVFLQCRSLILRLLIKLFIFSFLFIII